mmetsp:Transcript_7810/g.13778  ORF Transcript_7810/g.13778 Transcript_7810/m.13778 type:complete len:119 (+) Transcript_7810:1-357(+)
MKCEVVRMLKLTSNSVEPLSFICPRKSDLFQADLYPDCYAGKPAMSASEFFDGKTKKPILMSMDPSKTSKKSSRSSVTPAFKPTKTSKQLTAELDKLSSYVDKLVSTLEKHNIPVPEP